MVKSHFAQPWRWLRIPGDGLASLTFSTTRSFQPAPPLHSLTAVTKARLRAPGPNTTAPIPFVRGSDTRSPSASTCRGTQEHREEQDSSRKGFGGASLVPGHCQGSKRLPQPWSSSCLVCSSRRCFHEELHGVRLPRGNEPGLSSPRTRAGEGCPAAEPLLGHVRVST